MSSLEEGEATATTKPLPMILPQPSSSVYEYTYLLYDEVESKCFGSVSYPLHVPIAKDTLCWVLKSRGIKSSRNRRSSSRRGCKDNNTSERRHPQSDSARVNTNGKADDCNNDSQRSELFLRARVVRDEQTQHGEQRDTDDRGLDRDDCSTDGHGAAQGRQRVLVRYPKGSQYHVRRSNLIPVLEPSFPLAGNGDDDFVQDNPVRFPGRYPYIVIVTPETPQYRRACVVHTCVGDTFLEIGCDFGPTVDRVQRALTTIGTPLPLSLLRSTDNARSNAKTGTNTVNGNNNNHDKDVIASNTADCSSTSATSTSKRVVCLGIDKSPESIRIATNRFPNCTFSLQDALTADGTAKLRRLCQERLVVGGGDCSRGDVELSSSKSLSFGPSVVAIDINGNRELPAVLSCLDKVMNPGNDVVVGTDWQLPRLIIVKSRLLYWKLKEC